MHRSYFIWGLFAAHVICIAASTSFASEFRSNSCEPRVVVKVICKTPCKPREPCWLFSCKEPPRAEVLDTVAIQRRQALVNLTEFALRVVASQAGGNAATPPIGGSVPVPPAGGSGKCEAPGGQSPSDSALGAASDQNAQLRASIDRLHKDMDILRDQVRLNQQMIERLAPKNP